MTDENKLVPPPPNPFEKFSPQAQEELKILSNIEVFLSKIEGLKGEEAFPYVEARQYIATRFRTLFQVEQARLKAEEKREALKVVPPAPTPISNE